MSEADVEQLLQPSEGSTGGPGQIVRHRAKVASVPNNARSVLRLILAERKAAAEQGKGTDVPEHGYFDGFLWSFVAGVPQLNRWEDRKCIPTETEVSIAMSKALKARGFSFVGPKICYSLMQSCGLVIDHPVGTAEWQAAFARLSKPAHR
mmetsp:Transcript_34876/g.74406  ORF Transcript_34876/g.74406 Transcript_34876/m.74406 type:complete len:150 (+) Transcript_34876:524-973(+)